MPKMAHILEAPNDWLNSRNLADHVNDTVENLNFYDKITNIRESYCPADKKEIERALAF